ncbi:MAG: peptidoglycan DD-metalloendopeptidase family protein [Clostridia bacterium]|nr:peptidoglycan DD-metalloendopeptidase family protein [Clostridia bacterium]
MSQKQVDTNPLHSLTAKIKSIAGITLGALACIGVGIYVSTLSSYDVAIRASINGEPCGYVASYSDMQNAASQLEHDVRKATGGDYSTDITVSFDLVHANKPEYLSEEDCSKLLWELIEDDFCEAYMLYVDDRQAAAYEDGDKLEALIECIEDELLEGKAELFSGVKIKNRLRVEKQLCLKSMLKSIDEIDAEINPLTKSENDNADANISASTTSDITAQIGAVMAASPKLVDDTDADYDVILSAGTAEISEDDLTLEYNFVNTVTLDETVYFETRYVDDPTRFIGTEKLDTAGINGKKRVTYDILYDTNGNIVGREAVVESIITPAVDRIILVGTKEIPDSVPTGTFIWPCETPYGISSGYGWRTIYGKTEFHLGIDLPDITGSSIWAADGGKVVWAGFTPSYGNNVRIEHANGYSTLYAHLDKILVSIGDRVYQGQEIGKMGSTGLSYGSHLHFETRLNDLTFDPLQILPKK